jgi:hypothetical protein
MGRSLPHSLLSAGKEEQLHDYNHRKANVEAAEHRFWDEELALHTIDVNELEKSVFRQRTLEWELRDKPDQFATAMSAQKFPFRYGA